MPVSFYWHPSLIGQMIGLNSHRQPSSVQLVASDGCVWTLALLPVA
jgi:hypothetical protein